MLAIIVTSIVIEGSIMCIPNVLLCRTTCMLQGFIEEHFVVIPYSGQLKDNPSSAWNY